MKTEKGVGDDEGQPYPQPGAAETAGADTVPQESGRGVQQKVLEGVNVKLVSVMRNIQDKSARRLLDRLAAGDSLGREEILPLLYKTMQPKLDNIISSLESITTLLQRALLRQILEHIDDLDRRVAVLDGMVEQYMAE